MAWRIDTSIVIPLRNTSYSRMHLSNMAELLDVELNVMRCYSTFHMADQRSDAARTTPTNIIIYSSFRPTLPTEQHASRTHQQPYVSLCPPLVDRYAPSVRVNHSSRWSVHLSRAQSHRRLPVFKGACVTITHSTHHHVIVIIVTTTMGLWVLTSDVVSPYPGSFPLRVCTTSREQQTGCTTHQHDGLTLGRRDDF